jgi:hypothetical protein
MTSMPPPHFVFHPHDTPKAPSAVDPGTQSNPCPLIEVLDSSSVSLGLHFGVGLTIGGHILMLISMEQDYPSVFPFNVT